jgi:hypothetical protein
MTKLDESLVKKFLRGGFGRSKKSKKAPPSRRSTGSSAPSSPPPPRSNHHSYGKTADERAKKAAAKKARPAEGERIRKAREAKKAERRAAMGPGKKKKNQGKKMCGFRPCGPNESQNMANPLRRTGHVLIMQEADDLQRQHDIDSMVLSEDSKQEAPVTGFNRHMKLMSPATRELVLQSRQTEIEAFAMDRGLNPAMVAAVAEVSMRMGRVPDLFQYGFSGDDALAVKHFISGDVLNNYTEDADDSAEVLSEGAAQTTWKQLRQMKINGFPLPLYLGAKNPTADKDQLTVTLRGKWKGRVIIKLNKGTDLYDLTFGRVRKYEWKVDCKVLGVEVGNLAHVLQRYVEYGEARGKKGKVITAGTAKTYGDFLSEKSETIRRAPMNFPNWKKASKFMKGLREPAFPKKNKNGSYTVVFGKEAEKLHAAKRKAAKKGKSSLDVAMDMALTRPGYAKSGKGKSDLDIAWDTAFGEAEEISESWDNVVKVITSLGGPIKVNAKRQTITVKDSANDMDEFGALVIKHLRDKGWTIYSVTSKGIRASSGAGGKGDQIEMKWRKDGMIVKPLKLEESLDEAVASTVSMTYASGKYTYVGPSLVVVVKTDRSSAAPNQVRVKKLTGSKVVYASDGSEDANFFAYVLAGLSDEDAKKLVRKVKGGSGEDWLVAAHKLGATPSRSTVWNSPLYKVFERTFYKKAKKEANEERLYTEAANLFDEAMGDSLDEVSPPGMSGTVKAMKDRHSDEISNPYALAWSMYKKGDKPRIEPEENPQGMKKYISPGKYEKYQAKKDKR